MAESVVSFVSQHIVSMIADEANALADMKPELAALHTELTKMKDYLIDAEKKRELAYNEQVRTWLRELRNIAYEAEDVVDNFVLDSGRLFKLRHVHKATKKLRRLQEQMLAIKSKLDAYGEGSTDSPTKRRSRARGSQVSKGYLQADDDYVVGIEEDVNQLVEQLVGPSVDVLSIVGMGGSGKTTLARKIYDHRKVKKCFHFRAWVTLPSRWDVSVVLLEILRQTARGSVTMKGNIINEDRRIDVLGSQFQDALKGKTCLVVLDDVWGLESLHAIVPVLIQQAKAVVRIVITSRNFVKSPASHFRWIFHETKCLCPDDSWELFNKAASRNGKALDSAYHVLAKEMLRKCQGLPLAIVALGKLLKTKDTVQEWERVFSQIEGAEGTSLYRPVNDILALSFDELPYYLKPCFLYLGLFPQGSSISVGNLVRMWIAEGFVKQRQQNETLESAARKLLQELIDHTMVQVVRRNYAGKVKTLRVHDIMRELCIMKARELDFLMVFAADNEVASMSSRRAAINPSMRVGLPIHNSHLRSLVVLGQSRSLGVGYANKRNHVALNLALVCEHFKLLRVLELAGIKTTDGALPDQMGCLIHLRYLRIRSTNIRQLPKSIGKLRNLLTLDYWDVSVDMEIKLPNVLWKLKRLRHLYLPNEMSRTRGELNLHTLKDLQTLWGVGGGSWMLQEMKTLSSSLEKLYIQGISCPEHLDALFKCHVIPLSVLALDWFGFELKSLEALCSRTSLIKLRLMGRALDELHPLKFPSSLQKLELYYTQLGNAETMAALGKLPSLKFLRLAKESYIGSQWTCNEEAFPELEELKLSNLRVLEQWNMMIGAMPRLRKLSIVSCINLKRIPDGLQSVCSLERLEITQMPFSFCSRLRDVKDRKATGIGGEDFHIVKHIPHIGIRDACASSYGLSD